MNAANTMTATVRADLASRINALIVRAAKKKKQEQELAAHDAARKQAEAIWRKAVAQRKADDDIAMLAVAAFEAFLAADKKLAPLAGVKPTDHQPAVEFMKERLPLLKGHQDTVKKQAKTIKSEAKQEDWTTQETDERLDKAIANAGKVLVETEAQAAYGAAQMRILERAGFATKFWVTENDERVRDSHVKCEEQGAIPIKDRFGNGLMYPGDPAGEPADTINCRCSLLGGRRK